jgi:type II secretory pathway pseudopilin PulG
MKYRTRRMAGFTMVEMLVIVAILTLLLPTLERARYSARHAVCQSNLRQIAFGFIVYASDFKKWYPIGDTSGRSPFIPVRPRTWDIPNNESYNHASQYFGGKFGNYRDMTVDGSEVFVCPQGATEVPWKPGSTANSHSGNRAFYQIFPGRAVAYSYDTSSGVQDWIRKYTMLRLGDAFQFDTAHHSAFYGPSYHGPAPIASDFCQIRQLQSTIFRGLATNHVLGGDRHYNQHFSPAPMYWGTQTGVGQANFVFEDGAVRQWTNITYNNIGDTSYTVSSLGVGNCSARLPKDWAQDPRLYE